MSHGIDDRGPLKYSLFASSNLKLYLHEICKLLEAGMETLCVRKIVLMHSWQLTHHHQRAFPW